MDDIDPTGVREAQTLILAFLVAREAERSGRPDDFLDGIDAMLAPLLRTDDGFKALAWMLRLAATLQASGRTDPLRGMPE